MLLTLISHSKADSPPTNGPPVTKSDGSTLFVAQGEFRPSLEAARESALRTAQEQLKDWLSRQDPPVRHVPTLEEIRRDFKPHEHRPETEQILSDRMYKITLEVTLTPKALHELRGRDRVATGVWAVASACVLLTGLSVVLRFRRWRRET